MNVSLFFKLVCFSHVCLCIRSRLKEMESKMSNTLTFEEMFQENELSKKNFLLLIHHKESPENLISISHFIFYLLIPTFNFQLRYAKKDKINKIALAKRFTEMIILFVLFFLMVAYWVLPLIQESDSVFVSDVLIFKKITYFIRLSMACTFSWMIMFFAVFHGFCETISELVGFSDRRFYLDWWNSLKISQYWRLWNLPIHSFFLCHVSNPLTSLGVNRHVINTIIFFISAIFHEYVISLALKRFCTWTLITFSLQYFYIMFETEWMKFFKLEKSVFGNYLFWTMLCFYGQPTLVLQYYFYIKYGKNFSLWPF